jgi:type II secretory ATPase GspE/PulE/Tfp pilus assembly ATPase PilB-like protein
MTDDLKDAVTRRASRAELKELTVTRGMRPLRLDGWAKVEAGLTTVEEVLRVVES